MTTPRERRWLPLLLAALLLAAPSAVAEDEKDDGAKPAPKELPLVKEVGDKPVSGDDAAKMAISRFKQDFRQKDEGKRMNAIQRLAGTKNDLIIEELGKLLSHRDAMVRSASVMVMDEQYSNYVRVGEILKNYLDRGKEDDEDVLMTLNLTIGRIEYRGAIEEQGDLLKKHASVFVKMEVLRAFQKLKDKRALLPIVELWLKEPHGYSWEGGEVTYDSGASGDADQKEAERQYQQKYGNQTRHGAPPVMLKTYVQMLAETVHVITGEKLEGPTDLMAWMVAHEDELGYELPGSFRKEYEKWQKRKAQREKQKK